MTQGDREPVLLGGVRTPVGRFLGGLSSLPAPELGARVVEAVLERTGVDPSQVDEVIMGNVVSAGAGQAPARQAAVRGGVPPDVPAVTVNKVCGSGLKAAMLGAQAIRAGDADLVVVGGFESMSRAPYYLEGHREGVKFGDRTVRDGLIHDGLWCSFGDCHMGGYAEYTATKAGITREEADGFSLRSHQKAVAATEEGLFDRELMPVEVTQRKKTVTVDRDETPRADTTMEALGRLKPAFPKDAPAEVEELVVTPGNAPGLNDGAAALVMASGAFARAHGLQGRARVTGYAAGGTDPKEIFFAPVVAVNRLSERAGVGATDFDLVELNEAFAVQALADIRELGLDEDRVNVHGGAVALGHPIGASGARILVTLMHALESRDQTTGLASLCLGGGNAVALSIERV